MCLYFTEELSERVSALERAVQKIEHTQTKLLNEVQQLSNRLFYTTNIPFDNFYDSTTAQEPQTQQQTTLQQTPTFYQQTTFPQQTTVTQPSVAQPTTLTQQQTTPQTQQTHNTPQTNSNPQRTCDNNSSPLPLNPKLRNKPLILTRQPDSFYYTIEEATELYKHYIDNNMPGTFAQLLAKEAVFGPEVMKQCTPNGNGSLYALPQNGLYKIKKIVFDQYPQYWSKPQEFEPVWSRCQRAIEQCCGRLRRKA